MATTKRNIRHTKLNKCHKEDVHINFQIVDQVFSFFITQLGQFKYSSEVYQPKFFEKLNNCEKKTY